MVGVLKRPHPCAGAVTLTVILLLLSAMFLLAFLSSLGGGVLRCDRGWRYEVEPHIYSSGGYFFLTIRGVGLPSTLNGIARFSSSDGEVLILFRLEAFNDSLYQVKPLGNRYTYDRLQGPELNQSVPLRLTLEFQDVQGVPLNATAFGTDNDVQMTVAADPQGRLRFLAEDFPADVQLRYEGSTTILTVGDRLEFTMGLWGSCRR